MESVTWISERKDVLCAFFWILTMGAYLYYARRPSWRSAALVLLGFALALASKAMAVTLPAALLLLDYWPLRRLDSLPAARRAVLEKVPLVGLTALVMAREWERGTLEALFVTPARADEILLGKTIPYFVLGMAGLALCFLAAKFLFRVPFRGSVWVLTGVSMLYLLVALGTGLLISSAVKSQFVASQVTVLVSFLPALMLSGFLYDLHSMPAPVRLITYALPARYYVALLQTVFLAGDVWGVIWPNAAVLAGMATVLLLLTRRATRKKLS